MAKTQVNQKNSSAPKTPRWHQLDVENFGVYYDPTAPDSDLPRHLVTSVRMKMTTADVLEQNLFNNPNLRVVVPIEVHPFPGCHYEVIDMEKPSPRSSRIEVVIKYITPADNPCEGLRFNVRMNPKARLHIIVNQ